MAVMLIPAHECCLLLLFALIAIRDIGPMIKDPFGRWLIGLWLGVAIIDGLTFYGKLEENSVYYIFSGSALSLSIPLAFLFVRKYHLRQPFQRKDFTHVAPFAIFVMATLIFDFVSNPRTVTYYLLYEAFGYVLSIVYIFLLLLLYHQSMGRQKKRDGAPQMPGNKAQNFSAAHVRRIISAIEMTMTSETAYLQKKYSLHDLAGETGIPAHHLSAFINSYYNMNFSDFINKHRIEYFKRKVAEDPAWQGLTLEGIARDCGFGNRNTFTVAFKKLHGITPGQFLRSPGERQTG